ncbi:MAG: hypothetical protein HYR51_11055 [Candidatus Rokubacteria bacterium]|nr:hypothetical protein [Candidatus Rokubacteria bacterium]
MTRFTGPRRAAQLATMSVFALAATGCATAPLLQKQSFDFRTTALFAKPCLVPDANDPAPAAQARETSQPAAQPVALVVERPAAAKLETRDNRCNTPYLEKMVESFLTIKEIDEKRGVGGDTLDDVRRKGFTIHIGGDPRIQRVNTRSLHGADALAAVGMAVSAPPLQKPEEIKAYTEFMGQHYGEEYFEKDMKRVVDRFCLNRRESVEVGEDRIFTIVWRDGRVLKRVIKGGPIDNPKQERGFLLCPGDFIVDTLTGTVGSAAKAISPVP